MTNHGCMAMTLKPKPNHLNGKHFATIEEIKEKSKQKLLAIPKRSFQKCFEDWKKRVKISVLYLREVTLKGTR